LSEVWRRNFLWQTRICIYVFLFVRENKIKHINIYTHAHACTRTWGAPRWTIIPRWITLCGCKPSLVVAPFFQKRLGGLWLRSSWLKFRNICGLKWLPSADHGRRRLVGRVFVRRAKKNMEMAKLQEVGSWEGEVRSFNDGH
jgi:hypothetical protein